MRRGLAVITATVGVVVLTLTACGERDGSVFGATPSSEAAVSPPASPSSNASPSPNASPSTSPSPVPSPTALFHPGAVTLSVKGFWSWAYLDFATGASVGSSPPSSRSDTASMMKSWVAADYLRRAGVKGQRPSATIMAELSTMIRDSDSTHTFEFHLANGNLSSIQRMIKTCGLTDTKGQQNSWSLTEMSARDVTRLGKCIADGRAAGLTWTGWLLNEMRSVRGEGRFGVIEALPPDVAKSTAVKNGWLDRDDGLWHIACMAIGPSWSIGVMARYPASLGKDYGANICRDVTKQLLS